MLKCLSTCFLLFALFVCNDAFAEKVYPIKSASIFKSVCQPVIDANIGQEEYQGSATLHGFKNTAGESSNSDSNTLTKVTYDDQFLYIVVTTTRPHSNSRSLSGYHDDPLIFYDDRVEVFLDINHDHRSYYNLVVNLEGNQFDQKIFQPLPGTRTHFKHPDWNAYWKAKSISSDSLWTVEIAVSLQSLGLVEISKGMTIGFNVGVVKDSKIKPTDDARKFTIESPTSYLAWTYVKDGIWETLSNFNAPEMFGDLIFEANKVNVKKISFPSPSFQGKLGKLSLQGFNPIEIELGSGNDDLELSLEVTTPDGGDKFSNSNQEVIQWTHQQKITDDMVVSEYYLAEEAENKLIIKILDGKTKETLYHTSYILIVPPFLNFDLEPLYSKSASSKPITCSRNFDRLSCDNCFLNIQFIKEKEILENLKIEEIAVLDKPTPLFDPNRIAQLEGGTYQIKSTIIERSTGKSLHEFSQFITKFEPNRLPSELEVVEENYSYGGIEDHAVVVKFPGGANFVFWKKAAYVPWWDIDQAVTSNEFVEAWGGGIEGCAEPLQDRECRYSYVEILENTPARVKVKWRYALNDAHYKIYANEWVEEFYTFYPDGTGVREVNLFANTSSEHEVFEAIYVNPPQVSTYQLYDKEIASITTLSGQIHTIHQFQGDNELYSDVFENYQNLIFESHFKDRLHPFTVLALGDSSLLPGIMRDRVFLAKWLAPEGSRRGHWPASRYSVDGYNAVSNDLPGHFNLGSIHVMTEAKEASNRWLFLIGVKTENDSQAIIQAKNWINPPELKPKLNDIEAKYSAYSRSYKIQSKNRMSKMIFTSYGELINPVLSFSKEQYSSVKSIEVNGEKLKGSSYIVEGVSGDLVVFLNRQIKSGSSISIML